VRFVGIQITGKRLAGPIFKICKPATIPLVKIAEKCAARQRAGDEFSVIEAITMKQWSNYKK